MSGKRKRLRRKRQQLTADGVQRIFVTARQVRSPDAPAEKRIAHEHGAFGFFKRRVRPACARELPARGSLICLTSTRSPLSGSPDRRDASAPRSPNISACPFAFSCKDIGLVCRRLYAERFPDETVAHRMIEVQGAYLEACGASARFRR